MSVSVKDTILCARLVTATRAGNRLVPPEQSSRELPRGCKLLHGHSGIEEPLAPGVHLEPPFEEIPVMPSSATYAGQVIGVMIGPDWPVVDQAVQLVEQEQDISLSTESRLAWTDEGFTTGAAGTASSPETAAAPDLPVTPAAPAATEAPHSPDAPAPPDTQETPEATDTSDALDAEEAHLVEGLYRTEVQLHRLDAPLWVDAQPESSKLTLRIPTQWPGHVRRSVAAALDIDPKRVDLRIIPVEGGRDGALYFPSLLAVLVASCAIRTATVVRLAMRSDQMLLTGGRSPASVKFVSRLDRDGSILGNAVDVRLDHGAYPTLVAETRQRLRAAAEGIYRTTNLQFSARALRTVATPMGAFEGVGTAQLTFAREVHYNRLAGIAEEDPILWRIRHFRKEWPVLPDLAKALADLAGFHRRFSANELVRKRRLQLPRNTTALKGIGCAFGEQLCGLSAEKEQGYVSVQLGQDGIARLYCSVPTPTPRLRQAWRSIVAEGLQISVNDVSLDTSSRNEVYDSGPRLFSRGSSVIPRAILSACEAIQKQRFREPLPIQVRRSVRTTKATRNPADAQRSLGSAAVEATIIPATMAIDVRSVTLVMYAGRILDRHAAEAEVRRGIYQALSWTLHETVDRMTRETTRERDLMADPLVQRHYNPGFLGAPPKIKVVFLPAGKKDAPVGVGELPFLTVPAALISALSQASGLYLDSIPASPREMLRMLQEEEE